MKKCNRLQLITITPCLYLLLLELFTAQFVVSCDHYQDDMF